MKLTFLGAVKTVTGSKYLLESSRKKVLIDCGLFQGLKDLRLLNRRELPVDPKHIDAVVLTHAHIDHTGYIPLLVKRGFRGKIYCSAATRDLCAVLLPDSGHLQEEDARFANKHKFSKHSPAEPLYNKLDAIKSLKYFHPVEIGKNIYLEDNFSFQLNRSGHILGATFVTFKENTHTIVFSGDIGRPNDPIMMPPSIIQNTDYLVMESTYGNRKHSAMMPEEHLGKVINETFKRGGTILIPAFAVGRSQLILHYIYQLKQKQCIPDMPVFLDSPMAIEATKMFCKHHRAHRLTSKQAAKQICDVATHVVTPEESKQVDTYAMPKIIISASGMATGGRVLHHLRVFLPDHKSTVLLTGFQAAGTRGRRLIEGAQTVKIFGQEIPVKAEIDVLRNSSAHADYNEILDWLAHFKNPPKKVFLTHGEESASIAMKEKIEKQFGWNCVVPEYKDSFEL